MAILQGFINGAYRSRSLKAAADRCMNLMPIAIDKTYGPSGARAYLIGTPGRNLFSNLNSGTAQGLYEANGRCFAVCGGRVYEVFADGTNATIGGNLGTLQAASMSNNPTQLIIVCGPGFIVNLNGVAALTPIPITDGFSLASTVTFQDSYFIASVQNTALASAPGSTKFIISAPNDGLVWNGLDFGNKEGGPDPLAAVLSVQKILWLIGTKTCEPYWNNGVSTPPFIPIQGMLRDVGTAAYMSPAIVGSEACWLAQDKRGTGYVVSTQNVNAIRISTYGIEDAIQGYIRDGYGISDAIGSSYQENGQIFYKLDFPAANASWVFDSTMREWHERGLWSSQQDRYLVDRGRFQCFCFGKHLTLSDNGIVYNQSQNFYDDGGDDIRRLRVAPHQSNENTNIEYSHLQLDLERGTAPLGVNPLYTLRYSDTGGELWSQDKIVSAGLTGKYKYPRCIWRQLGSGRDRVHEISTVSRSAQAWIAAYYDSKASTETSG